MAISGIGTFLIFAVLPIWLERSFRIIFDYRKDWSLIYSIQYEARKNMSSFISKIFGGNKSEKDVKKIRPLVEQINQFFNQYQSISNDELRNKTVEFRQRINDFLSEIDATITERKSFAENLGLEDMTERDLVYQEVDKLLKEKNQKLEIILKEILPEAFAVVKETARRFKENSELVSTATELDKDFSIKKDYIRIEGDKAIYKNTWTAAGGTVTWNMVHYDVQLDWWYGFA